MSEELMLEENKEKKTPQENFITLRNFRKSPEVENFYRFISENDLRREAQMILEVITSKLAQKKKKKSRKIQ
ncbi:MAG: hypothetical protein VXW15_08660 [Bdellovibrionota bacterium]|nr:hypothetical protein [Bdellovibrionota bacterium]